MAAMTGTLILKLDSQTYETEEGSLDVEFGGDVYEGKMAPATGAYNDFAKTLPGSVSATLHATKAADIEFLRKFRGGEVVVSCKDTKKQWQMNNASISESLKLQDNGRGMPIKLMGQPLVQTKG